MSERDTRLVHVTTTDISLELLLGAQLEAFSAAGYDLLTVSAPGPFLDALSRRGIEHLPARHLTRAWSPVKDVHALVELYRLFRRLRPTIVHTHNPKPGVYGRIAARLARVPVVVNTVHGLYATPEDRLLRRALVYSLERLAAMFSHAELVQGREDLARLRKLGVPAHKLELLGNGIDLRRFARDDAARARIRAELGVGERDVVVGCVARLVWEKGLRQIFDAAADLRRTGDRVVIVVIGPHEPDKADAVGEADVRAAEADGVRLVGFRADVEDWYSAMDVFVHASRREGFLRSGMEAAACGLPLVVTDAVGCREVVDDGVNGFLVPLGDGAALAGRIRQLAEDHELRRVMGDASLRKAAAEFDQQRVIDTTLATYERLLRRAGGKVAS